MIRLISTSKMSFQHESGAQIAIEIKGFTDAVQGIVDLVVPEKAQLQGMVIHHAPEIARAVTRIGVLVTYAKKNAEAASAEGTEELFKRYAGQFGSAPKLLLDMEAYARTKQDAQEYRDEVQLQVTKINDMLRLLDAKRKTAVANMYGYQDVVEAIDMLCNEPKQTKQAPGVLTATFQEGCAIVGMVLCPT